MSLDTARQQEVTKAIRRPYQEIDLRHHAMSKNTLQWPGAPRAGIDNRDEVRGAPSTVWMGAVLQ